MRRITVSRLWAVAFTTAVAACSGGIETAPPAQTGSETPESPGAPRQPGSPGGPANGGPVAAACTVPSAAPGRLRRLTRVELDNTFRDVLGDTSRPAAALDLEPQVGAFYNSYADLWVDKRFLEKYVPVARGLATRAAKNVATLHPCAWATEEAGCVKAFVERFGEKLFRQPVAAAAAGKYVGLFTSLRAHDSVEDSLQGMLEAMLLAPELLYRNETRIGAQAASGEAGILAQHQVAAQLSYMLWAAPPDEALRAAARAGQLRTPAQVESQARRLLADGKAREGLLQFFEQLLDFPKYDGMEKDAKELADFGPALVEEMKAETRAFLGHTLTEGDGTLATVFTAGHTFLPSAKLAQLYGVTGEVGLARKTTLPAMQRAGLLTQAGFLAYTSPRSGTKPVTRGHFILERLLCTELGQPAVEGLEIPPGVATANLTTREKFQLHTDRAECAACHKYLDPIGFGLEHYDAVGRYRTKEGAQPIDAKGNLFGTGDQDGPFEGAIELSRKLATSQALRGCMTKQYFRYALGRREAAADGCALQSAEARLAAARGDLRELALGVALSDAFLTRSK